RNIRWGHPHYWRKSGRAYDGCMPTKKDTGDRRPAPTMPEAVTSTAAWAIQRLDARLRDAIEGVLAEHAADVALTVRGYWLLEAIGAEPAHSQRELCD